MSEQAEQQVEVIDHQEQIRLAYEHAQVLNAEGKDQYAIISALQERGISHDAAKLIVSNIVEPANSMDYDDGKDDMLKGALWLGGGIAVTAITYSMASGGGTYLVTYGPIIYGAIKLIQGISKSAR